MSDLELPNTAQTVVGLDRNYYRPSHLLRGGAEKALGFNEETAQMELELPSGLLGLYGFAWPRTPRWSILNGDEVLIPVIGGQSNVRRCENGYSCLLQAGNMSVISLERKIQELRNNGIIFSKAISPEIFGDAIDLEVFISSPINMEDRGDTHGTGRLIMVSGEVSYVGSDFPLIVIKLGRTPSIKGWVWVKKHRYMTYKL